ncbi:MAG: DNA-processing protein DprA [Bdellovibrionia bacterium]
MKRFCSSYPVHHFVRSNAEADSPLWPLWKVARPPNELFIQGKAEALDLLSRLPARGLAIVGSRECQPRSLHEITRALRVLRGFDLVIVSGLARGIDAHAHAQALDLGFPTVAILGCGMDWSYPEENDELRHRILDSGGLVVSEFACDAAAKPDHFIRRNRLIAGWSSATWIVEAGARSGAINTATWAKQQDRPCFVTPCYPDDPTLEGNQRLLESRKVSEGQVRPFWSARSLGEVWLDLESFFAMSKKGPRQASLPLPPVRTQPNSRPESMAGLAKEIRHEVLKHSFLNGGMTIEQLLQWGKNRGEKPEIFYQELRTAIESGDLLLRGSSLIAPSL